MKSGTYDLLKQVAQIWLPALGSAYFTLAGIWGLPNPDEVVGTIVVLDTLLGSFLHINTQAYNAHKPYDGEMSLVEGEDGSELHMKQTDIEALFAKDEVTFKLNKVPLKKDLAG